MEPLPEITRKMLIPSEMTLKETKKNESGNSFFQPKKTQVLRFFIIPVNLAPQSLPEGWLWLGDLMKPHLLKAKVKIENEKAIEWSVTL